MCTSADLVKAPRMAESSVKRIRAKGDMPLSRVDAICVLSQWTLEPITSSFRLNQAEGVATWRSLIASASLRSSL